MTSWSGISSFAPVQFIDQVFPKFSFPLNSTIQLIGVAWKSGHIECGRRSRRRQITHIFCSRSYLFNDSPFCLHFILVFPALSHSIYNFLFDFAGVRLARNGRLAIILLTLLISSGLPRLPSLFRRNWDGSELLLWSSV